MGYTVLERGICADCGIQTLRILLDEDIDGDDSYAGIGWFHITGDNEVSELCPQ
jgi:hypothetical protein